MNSRTRRQRRSRLVRTVATSGLLLCASVTVKAQQPDAPTSPPATQIFRPQPIAPTPVAPSSPSMGSVKPAPAPMGPPSNIPAAEISAQGATHAAPPTTTLDAAPQADRLILTPTATTQPAGTWTLTSYDIIVLQVTHAFTDRTQLSVTMTPPLQSQGGLFPVDISLKKQLFRGEGFRFAMMGSATGLSGVEDLGTVLVGRAGGIAQFCRNSSCDSSFVLASNLTLAGPLLFMTNTAGAILQLGNRLQLLVEVSTLLPVGRVGGQANGIATGAGLRYPWQHWSLDLSVVRFPSIDQTPSIPLLALSWRD